jgi:hypothetical protein
MRDQPPGAAFVDKLDGAEIRVDIRDIERFFAGDRTGDAVAMVNGRPAKSGSFVLDGRWRTYELMLDEPVSLRSRSNRWGVLRSLQSTGTDSFRQSVAIVARLARMLA